MKNRTYGPVAAALLAALLLVPDTQAAVDIFLKPADIKGESVDKVHKGEVDVLAWSWGMTNSGTTHMGGGGGAGKANFQDLSLTKYVDSASPALMLACANGMHYAEFDLVVRKAGQPVEYIKLKLKEVMVTSVSTGGSGGEDRLTENITLNFAQFVFEYTPQDEKGKPLKSISFSWDIAENAPL